MKTNRNYVIICNNYNNEIRYYHETRQAEPIATAVRLYSDA